MALDAASGIAPAQRISPSARERRGSIADPTPERVRANYWPDQLSQQAAAVFPVSVLDLDLVDSREAAESSAPDPAPMSSPASHAGHASLSRLTG